MSRNTLIMNKLKTIIVSCVLLLGAFNVFAGTFNNENLHYVISYKWGLIHKDAGEAVLSLKNQGDFYQLRLVGKTKPWADKFYQVRDTLSGKLKKDGLKPLTYTKVAHEKGKYSRDDIKYIYSGNSVDGHAKRVRQKKDGSITSSEKKLSGTWPVYDMLSVFYFLRNIDYARLKNNQVVTATVFSGSKVESITIRCVGEERIKLRDKSERDAYHIKFKFTQAGKRRSSDDIDTWISTDSSHIPLLVVGSLPVGQVKCYYVGGK